MRDAITAEVLTPSRFGELRPTLAALLVSAFENTSHALGGKDESATDAALRILDAIQATCGRCVAAVRADSILGFGASDEFTLERLAEPRFWQFFQFGEKNPRAGDLLFEFIAVAPIPDQQFKPGVPKDAIRVARIPRVADVVARALLENTGEKVVWAAVPPNNLAAFFFFDRYYFVEMKPDATAETDPTLSVGADSETPVTGTPPQIIMRRPSTAELAAAQATDT